VINPPHTYRKTKKQKKSNGVTEFWGERKKTSPLNEDAAIDEDPSETVDHLQRVGAGYLSSLFVRFFLFSLFSSFSVFLL
jgi:indole-3-glycerol phosphate synthase